MTKVIFSGIQPSGNLHIGNYIGAIKQWVELQNSSKIKVQKSKIDDNELIFCIVDLHAITIPQNPKVLREKILEVGSLYMACGIDPTKSKIFVQSENPDHPYLGWIFDCILPFGSLFRMTQFKDKGEKQQEGTTVGLFNYPALMAADILLYDTDEVPVGEDQKQHIELTRDVAEKFNRTFCHPELDLGSHKLKMLNQAQHDNDKCIFKLPNPLIQKETARIMSLQDPLSKMSKSDRDPLGTINLLDEKDSIVEKVKKAVTDSGSEIVAHHEKPAMSNLLTIYSSVSGVSIVELEKRYEGVGYAEFKKDLAEVLVSFLSKIQKKYQEIRRDEKRLNNILSEGRDYAVEKSSKKVREVNKAVGLGRR